MTAGKLPPIPDGMRMNAKAAGVLYDHRTALATEIRKTKSSRKWYGKVRADYKKAR
jgi:hypothetical protein